MHQVLQVLYRERGGDQFLHLFIFELLYFCIFSGGIPPWDRAPQGERRFKEGWVQDAPQPDQGRALRLEGEGQQHVSIGA